MPNPAIVAAANASGALLGDWLLDPSRGGSLAGHAHAEVSAVAGAGKTHHLTAAASRAVGAGARVLLCAFTNEQVISLAERLAGGGTQVVHYAAQREVLLPAPAGVTSTNNPADCRGARAVACTAYKAGSGHHRHASDLGRFDVGLVDEAYQVRTDRTALWMLGLAGRWAFVGDSGQIEVFTTLPSSPFLGPSDPVTSIVDSAREQGADIGRLEFDWTWRLPAHGAPLLAPFYDMRVASAALPADREMVLGPAQAARGIARAANRAVQAAAGLGWAFLELPGEALDPADGAVAEAVAAVVAGALGRGISVRCERHGWRPVRPADIGVAVSTNAQRTLVEAALRTARVRGARVATYNGHQGLEYALCVLWHPASGLGEADAFYLDMGRLCVGVSRHRHAAVVVGRHGLRRIFADPPLSPEAPWPGRADRLLGGWRAHAALLDHIDSTGGTIVA